MWGVTPIRGTVCFGKQYHFIKKISNKLLAHLVTVMWRSKWKFWPTPLRKMKICVLQKNIVCFGLFKSMLAINLKKLSGLGLQHIVCAISQFSWVHKKTIKIANKSLSYFLEKQKVSSVELSEKETYVSRRDCYPTFPHPNMNPEPWWFPNQQVIPLSRWLF